MKKDVKKEILAIVVNIYVISIGRPFSRIEDAMNGPIAPPIILPELRKPIDEPFLPDFPPRRQGGIADWMAPITILRAMNW